MKSRFSVATVAAEKAVRGKVMPVVKATAPPPPLPPKAGRLFSTQPRFSSVPAPPPLSSLSGAWEQDGRHWARALEKWPEKKPEGLGPRLLP